MRISFSTTGTRWCRWSRSSPACADITFRNIWALDQPPLAESSFIGDVADVTFDNVKYGQTRANVYADMPLMVSGGAQQPHFTPIHNPVAAFTINPPVFAPMQAVTFTADPSPGARYTWLFGDGTQASGRRVTHRFPDAEGTELTGRCRPL